MTLVDLTNTHFEGCEIPKIPNGTVSSEEKSFLRSGESVEFECKKGFSSNKNMLTCNGHDITPRSTRCYSGWTCYVFLNLV